MKPNGKVLSMLGDEVVVADAIALLAGVSFGGVVKVMWAMRAIQHASGIPLEALLDVRAIPAQLADEERRDQTTRMVNRILDMPMLSGAAHVLRIERRFGGDSRSAAEMDASERQ